MHKLQVGDIIEVFGWPMLNKLDAGRYRVSAVSDLYSNQIIYSFTKPKGKKVIIRHYASSVDPWIRDANHTDLNKIVIVNTHKIVVISCDEDGIDVSKCPDGVIVEIHKGNGVGNRYISRYDHKGKIS